MRNVTYGIHGCLARRHGEVQEELIVGGKEAEDLKALGRVLHHIGKVRGQFTGKQRGSRHIALMHLIAHRQRTGNNELEGNRAGFLERSLHSRAQIILDPAQAVNNLRGVSAKAHDLADSFVKGAVGVIAEGLITNHPQWHGAGNHTSHGAYTVHTVIGDKMNLTGSGHFCRLLQGGSHPFIYRGPHNSTLHRAAHLFPGDRRARMADGMVI